MMSLIAIKEEGESFYISISCSYLLLLLDLLRRAFSVWMGATRNSIIRRETLEQREEELRIATLSDAWDKWRDRIVEERLRGVVSHLCIFRCRLLMLYLHPGARGSSPNANERLVPRISHMAG